jgi:hypothetical protein
LCLIGLSCIIINLIIILTEKIFLKIPHFYIVEHFNLAQFSWKKRIEYKEIQLKLDKIDETERVAIFQLLKNQCLKIFKELEINSIKDMAP